MPEEYIRVRLTNGEVEIPLRYVDAAASTFLRAYDAWKLWADSETPQADLDASMTLAENVNRILRAAGVSLDDHDHADWIDAAEQLHREILERDLDGD